VLERLSRAVGTDHYRAVDLMLALRQRLEPAKPVA
jgi:hypothetical protein